MLRFLAVLSVWDARPILTGPAHSLFHLPPGILSGNAPNPFVARQLVLFLRPCPVLSPLLRLSSSAWCSEAFSITPDVGS